MAILGNDMTQSEEKIKQVPGQAESIHAGTQIEIWEQKSDSETTRQKKPSRTYLRLLRLKLRLLRLKEEGTPEQKRKAEELEKRIGI